MGMVFRSRVLHMKMKKHRDPSAFTSDDRGRDVLFSRKRINCCKKVPLGKIQESSFFLKRGVNSKFYLYTFDLLLEIRG